MISLQSLPFEIITKISTYLTGKDISNYSLVCRYTSLIKVNIILRIPSKVKKSDIVRYFTIMSNGNIEKFQSLKLLNTTNVIDGIVKSGIILRSLDLTSTNIKNLSTLRGFDHITQFESDVL